MSLVSMHTLHVTLLFKPMVPSTTFPNPRGFPQQKEAVK